MCGGHPLGVLLQRVVRESWAIGDDVFVAEVGVGLIFIVDILLADVLREAQIWLDDYEVIILLQMLIRLQDALFLRINLWQRLSAPEHRVRDHGRLISLDYATGLLRVFLVREVLCNQIF